MIAHLQLPEMSFEGYLHFAIYYYLYDLARKTLNSDETLT